MRKQKGFSLIELMIVSRLSIIAAIAIRLLRARMQPRFFRGRSEHTIVNGEVSFSTPSWQRLCLGRARRRRCHLHLRYRECLRHE